MRTALASTAACLLLAVGCAGDDGDSAAEFAEQANAICANYGPKIAAIPPPLTDVDEWAAIAGDRGDLLEAAVNELRQVVSPDDLVDDYGAWMSLKEETLAAVRELQTAGAAHDEDAVEAELATIDATEAEADPLAEELGLADCASADW